MYDVLIIGGGAVGLSLAWDLARHGKTVQVLDRGELGREASWAGAGIIPAASRGASQHPYEQLRGWASDLHPQWAADLLAATGIDNGYRRCGGVYLARTPGEAAALAAWAAALGDEGIEARRLPLGDLEQLEPNLAFAAPGIAGRRESLRGVYLLPGEAQLRNPRHLQALQEACRRAGVTLTPHAEVQQCTIRGDALQGVRTSLGSLTARQYCFTAGAWTGQLLAPLGLSIGVLPIRGQMALFRCPQPPLGRIVNEGSRYLVPRDDGRVLAGSTEEEVGFDKRTTAEAIAELTAFAVGLVPALREAEIERTWAGLRPASFDGLPYLGRLPGLHNAFLAAGHFRSGLYLSAPTAVVLSQLMRGQTPEIDLQPFRVGR